MKIRTAIVIVLAAAMTPVASPVSADTARVTSGTGWKAATHHGITSIDPNRAYRVTFTTAAIKHRYAPHVVTAVENLQALGVNISIGDVTNVDSSVCPSAGIIQFDEVYQPLGVKGYSRALPCHDTTDSSAWGGHVQMDSEYWDGSNPLPAELMANTFTHELLHVMGLAHPNEDLDGDGATEHYECERTSADNLPTMCSPNGGYRGMWAGKPGYFDRKGIAQLVANFSL